MDILDRFAETLGEEEGREILSHLQEFIEWYVGHGNDFVPSSNDDVGLRTYLMQMKMNGVSRKDQRRQIASLRRFYDWAESAGHLPDYHPFIEFSIERPTLTREQIRRRHEIFSGSSEAREIARLRALNQLTEQLNRSSDVQTTLTSALEILLSLMSLQTAWAFLLPSATSPSVSVSVSPSDEFSLAATYGLPPGLEKNDRYYLKNQKLCHCQAVMLAGHLKRAVNVVECTRLLEASRDNADNQGLMFHASVPILASGQPLGILNVATQDWQFLTGADLQLLSAVGAQVAIGLERARLFDVTQAQRLRLERELKLAREIQDSLLPEVLPEIPGFSLAAAWRSALEMAGDFYDIFSLPEDRWGIIVADVSDKGAAAAMYMAMTRSLIRTSAANYSSPAGALRDVNQHLISHSSSDMFVTVFYAVLDAKTQTLIYANAGQNPPLLRRAAGGIEKLTRTGAALGVIDELHLSDLSLVFAPGDSLVIYTDGVTDALNSQREEFDVRRLIESVASFRASNAKLQLDHLSKDLDDFIGDTPPFDDITFFILAREPAGNST
jgi:serine phosphatase RsbU (regulator of sigma subunit)